MIDRRTVSRGLAAAAIAALGGGVSRAAAKSSDAARAMPSGTPEASPIVKTASGPLQGVSERGVLKFLGVPYAAPTGDSGRFMPPRPPAAWTEVRRAISYGERCPQVPLGVSPFVGRHASDDPLPPPSPMQTRLASLFAHPPAGEHSGEDCLVLNVWTRGTDSTKRPVMVWLHGGGFAVGSGAGAAYDGTRLARRGDVVAALEWVRDNIAAFGGDPGNVTIFGESGGAGKVSVVCAMPAAKGLFHKAIMQSGPCLKIQDKARATAIAGQLLKDLALSPKQIPELQKMDAAKLAAAASAAEVKIVPRVLGFGPLGLIPLVDGIHLRHDPFDGAAAPESAAVPFLVGSTKDEATLFAGPLPLWGNFTEAQVVDLLKPLAGARAQRAFALYQGLHPSDSPSYLLSDAVTDFWMRQAANRVAELKAKQARAPAFVYVLDWEVDSVIRCPHGTDVALVFDNVAASPAIAAAADSQALADQMSDAWIAFARSGNPNVPKLPHWPAYSLPARPAMAFNRRSGVVNDYGKGARRFWEET